ncbi:MAG: hypothetical protein DCE90_04895 [Pseudanabaena sp.]|nr:MAG: hypothetical protein DCE90_04895 [Pseudanabaena sp.]
MVERINFSFERCKSLVKNFDRTLVNANAGFKLCFIRLMLKRLAATSYINAIGAFHDAL